MSHRSPTQPPRHALWLLSACTLALLAACGGGADATAPAATAPVGAGPAGAEPAVAQAEIATGVTTLALEAEALPEDVAAQLVQPAFHLAPVLPEAPDEADALHNMASAGRSPRQQVVPAELRGLDTRRLTLDVLEGALRRHAMSAGGSLAPAATSAVASVYTPAQIRAAYTLPALPAAGATLTAAQAASLGAGQTIYIVNAHHNPNAAAELSAFNQKFGLPTCASGTIAADVALPLTAAPATGCEFLVVYSTASATMSAVAPEYDAAWATEIAVDVQWAHATAPLARLVLIEAPDASLNNLLAGVKLANAMGPGVVSMSFGTAEGSWAAGADNVFSVAGMSYLAAAGDHGAVVLWPAVSANVLAVGGTTLSYSGSGARSETGWSNTGGGTSAYVATPGYQGSAVPGLGAVARRTVTDVAFNADPYSGQYVALMKPGTTTASWVGAGGTSLATPQWAGVVAVANALRANAGKAALGAPHGLLYGQIGTAPGSYASAFSDITQGSNGACATCSATTGYDAMTGLGTPNVANLLGMLSGSATSAKAPVVTPASIAGQVGTALSFTAAATAPNQVSFGLEGAPSGMVIHASTGVVTWATPTAGSCAVTVVATDSKTGLSGRAVYGVNIAAPLAPVVAGSTLHAEVGIAWSFTVSVSAPNPVTFSLDGAPAGLVISGAGVLSWASPVAGTYAVTVVASDNKTGLTGQGVYNIVVSAASATGPTITATPMAGTSGAAMAASIAVADAGATGIAVSISGAPLGMAFSMSGQTVVAHWARPVAGSYSLLLMVSDSAGRCAQATLPVTVK